MNPNKENILGIIGCFHQERKEYDVAIECYKRILELFPNSFVAICRLGSCYILTKEYEMAIELYKKIIEIDPSISSAWISLGSLYLTK